MKKIVIIGAVLLILAIVVFFVFVLSFKKPISQQSNLNPEISPVNVIGSSNPDIFRSNKIPADKNTWVEKNIDTVSVSYPQTWTDSKSLVEGGGFVSTMQPKDQKPGDAFPRVDIMVIPYRSSTQVLNLTAQMAGAGFEKTSVQYQGVQVAKFSSVIAGRSFYGGNPQKKDVIKDSFIFQKGSNVYEIDYSYYADSSQKNTEEIVSEIMRSISL